MYESTGVSNKLNNIDSNNGILISIKYNTIYIYIYVNLRFDIYIYIYQILNSYIYIYINI